MSLLLVCLAATACAPPEDEASALAARELAVRTSPRAEAAVSPVRGRLLALLQAFHEAPTPEELSRVAPAGEIAAMLVEIAGDESAPALARNRAIHALGEFSSPQGRALLQQLSQGAATPYARRLAQRSLERARSVTE